MAILSSEWDLVAEVLGKESLGTRNDDGGLTAGVAPAVALTLAQWLVHISRQQAYSNVVYHVHV